MLTKSQIDKRLMENGVKVPVGNLSPLQEAEEGCVDQSAPNAPHGVGHKPVPGICDHEDQEDPEVEKGWKKTLRKLIQNGYLPGPEVTSGEFPRDLQPADDPCVLPAGQPGLPAPLEMAGVPDEMAKVHDFLGTARLVTGPQDIGAGGLFTKAEAVPGPATFPKPGSVGPERFRNGPIRDGHAACSSDPPNTAKLPSMPGSAKPGKADPGQALTSRLPGED